MFVRAALRVSSRWCSTGMLEQHPPHCIPPKMTRMDPNWRAKCFHLPAGEENFIRVVSPLQNGASLARQALSSSMYRVRLLGLPQLWVPFTAHSQNTINTIRSNCQHRASFILQHTAVCGEPVSYLAGSCTQVMPVWRSGSWWNSQRSAAMWREETHFYSFIHSFRNGVVSDMSVKEVVAWQK